MTEFDVTDGVLEVVEDTELPRRLKDRVLATAEDRDVTKSQANEIATAVEAQYLDTRVDPLDPVGTVICVPGSPMDWALTVPTGSSGSTRVSTYSLSTAVAISSTCSTVTPSRASSVS